MANQNTPFGLRSVSGVSNGPYNGGVRQYSVAAGDGTAIYIGDLVKNAGTSQVINGETMSDVVIAATGDVFAGVVVGALPVTRDSLPYRAASTQRVLLVDDDPNALFEVQEIGTGTPFTANDIGLNCNISVVAGSTVTGLSGTVLDNGTEATTNTLDVKIVGLVNRPDNAVGAFAKWLVRINRHRFVDQLAGV